MIRNLDKAVADCSHSDHVEYVAVNREGARVYIPYAEFVGNLAKDMGTDTLDLLHGAVGVSGEAGELLDAVKKLWAYEKPMTDEVMKNIIEEIGDIEFYVTLVRLKLGITRTMMLDANAEKLGKRYADGYSNAAALARADKVGE